jgi:hypothetical protein
VIYQCYFRAEQQRRLFPHEPYRGFGLEPEVNSQLLIDCPELIAPEVRLELCEYAAFLHIWRRLPFDQDDWIGFTSYRQLDKSSVVFASKLEIEQGLRSHDYCAWHVCRVGHVRSRTLRGAAAQAEIAHGMHRFTLELLGQAGHALPAAYQEEDMVPYANYWVMPKRRFEDFMQWSWPLVRSALQIDHEYKRAAARSQWDDPHKRVGYFAERLFILWVMTRGLRGQRLGETPRMKCRMPARTWRQWLRGELVALPEF